MPQPLDVAALARIAGGAPKPIVGKMGDMDYCNALDKRWMAYRELDMKSDEKRVYATARQCWGAWNKAFMDAAPKK